MVSPQLLCLFTDSKHIGKKMLLKRGLKYYVMRQEYSTALDALDFDSHDHDLDLGTCLLHMVQYGAQNDPDGRELAIQIAQRLDQRDRNGLYADFQCTDNPFWQSLIQPETTTGFSNQRSQQLFVSSMQSQATFGGLQIKW
jgi:hypothetical protein